MNGALVRRVAVATLLATVALGLTGCFAFKRVEAPAGEVRTETKTIPKAGTSEYDVRLEMPAGILNVDSDTTALAEMKFVSSNSDWIPLVGTSESEGTSGTVTSIKVAVQGDLRVFPERHNKYEWNVHLSADVPSTMKFELGAGESVIDLRDVDVRNLSVTTGVGETTLDLSGERPSDLEADVRCGIGSVTIKVPEDAGVRISGRERGIGGLRADGFTMSGDDLTNDAWSTSPTQIEISIERGIGEVRIETVR